MQRSHICGIVYMKGVRRQIMEIQLWRELLVPYELAVQELIVKFEHMIKQYQQAGLYSPIEQVDGRVKKISSILAKAQRKGIALDEVTEKIDDIAGIRLICQFVEDIDQVVEIIHNRSDMTVLNEIDYVHQPKDSGYSSYHINISYEVMTIYGNMRIPVEIQIRTLAMNFWATIEHSLKYKYQGAMPAEISERLMASAKAVRALDGEMSSIREDVVDAQQLFREKAVVVADILNNLENLYKQFASAEDAIKNIQDEFQQIYNHGTLDELQEFGQRLDKLSANRNTQSLTSI